MKWSEENVNDAATRLVTDCTEEQVKHMIQTKEKELMDKIGTDLSVIEAIAELNLMWYAQGMREVLDIIEKKNKENGNE